MDHSMMSQQELMDAFDVRGLTLLVKAAAKKVDDEAKKIHERDKDGISLTLHLLVNQHYSKIMRRADYPTTRGLKVSSHLAYEARAILMDAEWQSKVGPMLDYAEEVDRLVQAAHPNRWPGE